MDNDDDCRDAENEAELQEARAWVRNAALGPPCPALRRSLWALVTRSRGKGANGALAGCSPALGYNTFSRLPSVGVMCKHRLSTPVRKPARSSARLLSAHAL